MKIQCQEHTKIVLLPLFAIVAAIAGLFGFFHLYGHTSKDFHTRHEVIKYSENAELQWNWALSSLEEYTFRGDESVLDIGCGNGKITAELARRVPDGHVVGLDLAPAMINYASSHFPRSEFRNLFFLQGDALANPFTAQFDLAVSFCAAHFIEDQKLVLEGIKKSLVPGGQALIVAPEAYSYNLSPVSERLAKTQKWNKYFNDLEVPVRHYKSVAEYTRLVQQVGLQALSIKSIMVDDTFKNRESFIEWILSISSFAKALPHEKRREFGEEVASEMLTECPPPRPDGTIIMRNPKLEVWLKNNRSENP